MAGREALKRELLDLCRRTDGGYGTAQVPWLERIRELMDALAGLSPEPSPLVSPRIDGRWRAEFASFGIKPEQGKGIRRDSDLMVNSFGKLPSAPIRVTEMYQDIDRGSGAYNNLVEFEIPGSPLRGRLVTVGRFAVHAEDPRRAVVSFFEVFAEPAGPGADEDAFRAALGLAPDAILRAEFRPPRVHSDVVYLDDEIRINIGSVGGNYVLSQTGEPPGTAALSAA